MFLTLCDQKVGPWCNGSAGGLLTQGFKFESCTRQNEDTMNEESSGKGKLYFSRKTFEPRLWLLLCSEQSALRSISCLEDHVMYSTAT